MEWRQQTSVSCADAFLEAQRWIEEVTGKSFACNDFRAALENGVLLCDLINQLKPGIIKRLNRLSTPIAGLDNVNVFLKACGKLGLNESQLFHPGDLQDLSTRATLRRDESNRRIKNVLITIYWLGRKAHLDAFYNGSQLNFKAFEGLLGLALSKALDEGSNVLVKDSGYRECWFPEKDECLHIRASYKTDNSVDSVDAVDSRALHPSSEGCGSDAEAEQVFKMETSLPSVQQNVVGNVPPPPPQRKESQDRIGNGCASPLARRYQIQFRPESSVQVNPGWIWSKSLSDIPMVYPVRKIPNGDIIYDTDLDSGIPREWNQENKRKCSVAAKDSEAQWQDDLTKWKNRRRSTKSDLRRKSQDREHVINQMINGALTNPANSEAGGQIKSSLRDQQSPRRHGPAPHPSSTSSSKSPSSGLQPHTQARLTRSYATEIPCDPTASLSPHNSAHAQGSTVGAMPASDVDFLREQTHFASLASDGRGVTTPSLEYPFSSQTQVKSQGIPTPFNPMSDLGQAGVVTNQISTLTTTIQPSQCGKSSRCSDHTTAVSVHKEHPFYSDPKVSAVRSDVNQTGSRAQKIQKENQTPTWESSVENGKGQQASGVQKYLFRAGSWSGSASLPRGYRRSEGSTRLSSAITAKPFGSKQSRVSSLPRLCSVENNQGVLQKNEKEGSPSPVQFSLKRQTATIQLKNPRQPSIKQKKANEGKLNDLEEVDNELRSSTFPNQSSFLTNGFHKTQTQQLPQPPSNLQSHGSQGLVLGSKGSVDHQKVDHSDMRVSLTLKPNSRPDFGFQSHWDSTGARIKSIQSGGPAELCVDDEIVAVNGVAVAHMSYTQWKDKMTSSLQTGSLTMDIRRYGNKDWSTAEGSHHNPPGQSRLTLNLASQTPVLIGCPDNPANSGTSAETTVRIVSKFTGQMDNVKQSKVMHGELADPPKAARNKGGSESAISDLQVPSLSPSSSSWSWNHEEDRRRQEKWQEEQERLLQEKYQRDQERLEEEWHRAQQDAQREESKDLRATFSVMNGRKDPASTLHHVNREEEACGTEKLNGTGWKHRSHSHGVQDDKTTEQAWAKSLSTPALDGPHKQIRGDERKRKGQSLSKVEQERQQILEEMKKRTQLLTDNSWIRQRSSSCYKEPAYVGVPLKRFESMDNLDALRQSSVSSTTFSYPRPHSAAAGYCVPSRNSYSRYSTGGILSQRNETPDPLHHDSAWVAADISEELRMESRFESKMRSHTVSPAISNLSPLVPPPCDQHTVLQITE
ncbi:uncharacterized protein V6R79_000721 [Siganus canaliculatus]